MTQHRRVVCPDSTPLSSIVGTQRERRRLVKQLVPPERELPSDIIFVPARDPSLPPPKIADFVVKDYPDDGPPPLQESPQKTKRNIKVRRRKRETKREKWAQAQKV
jgi:hypothetical protein